VTVLSPHYDASFDGVSFWEQTSSNIYQQAPITTEGGALHTPASDSNTFDDQGAGAQPFEITVGVDGAEYLALMSKRGDNGTLAYSGGSLTCTLIAILDHPGRVGALDIYKIGLRFQPGASVYRPQLAIQIDTATFPAHAITDITPYLAPQGFDVDLATDTDNGSARVTLLSLPGAADEGVRLYIYGDGDLLFNGVIADGGTAWNEDGTITLSCVDALFKLRNGWGGADRTYSAANVPPSTDTNTAQNIIEAAGVDSTLTHIEGEDRVIGTAQDIIIHGGDIDIDGNPSSNDVLIEFIRQLDKSVIPNHVTFTRANGAVYRLPRAIGSSVATFTTSNAWGFARHRQPGSITNKWLVKGLTIADIPTEAESHASNSFLVAPWEYNTQDVTLSIVDDPIWAQDLADWLVSDTNGRLNVVTWTSTLNNQTDILGSTVTVTSARQNLSSQDVFVTGVRHHADAQTATTAFTAVFRD
jgi:hypothetical protein